MKLNVVTSYADKEFRKRIWRRDIAGAAGYLKNASEPVDLESLCPTGSEQEFRPRVVPLVCLLGPPFDFFARKTLSGRERDAILQLFDEFVARNYQLFKVPDEFLFDSADDHYSVKYAVGQANLIVGASFAEIFRSRVNAAEQLMQLGLTRKMFNDSKAAVDLSSAPGGYPPESGKIEIAMRSQWVTSERQAVAKSAYDAIKTRAPRRAPSGL